MQKGKNKMFVILLLALYAAASALGMVLIRRGGRQCSVQMSGGKVSVSITAGFAVGICLYLLSFVLWVFLLQIFPLTYISPVAYGVVFIVSAVLSYLILGEMITKSQAVGAGFIIMGIIISSMYTR